ncbi:precorrin-3B C(17)-methyltransferase [Pseudomonas sp. RIT-PI-AD]|uniref:precorrin-3B C(17)-methyltransferase n=1 Tax=Pseudomonas sp. RIT-PI-AD TaxID=3035294 RepID=UPI0021D9B32E|nr:precorrin-3B C(17)-methyltransferase [Pseudomonas sp. RIT-PI-AD]
MQRDSRAFPPPAIILLGQAGLATARRLQAAVPGARVLGLSGRVEGADLGYAEFGETLRGLYLEATPIIALCAAGIVIRTLAPLLERKGAEPPVLAVAEDGSAVVPLLGGLGGVNELARTLASALAVAPAITTSGELRFGTCLLNPPAGYALADLEQGKRFVADLLGGASVRIEGQAPWLEAAQLPVAEAASRTIRVTPRLRDGRRDELLIHPRTVVARVSPPIAADQVRRALAEAGLALAALACLVAAPAQANVPALEWAAGELAVPLRFLADDQALPPLVHATPEVRLYLSDQPVDPFGIGRARGRLTVIGLGPGAAGLMVPAARRALDEAEDLLGYETYVKMAGPFRPGQRLHGSDNREELARARHAFEIAAEGRRVVVISSGDPGVFAMASAVLEALHGSRDPRWHAVDLRILPGVSAALATAARAGAPLGHDFCVMSLSDNLKPWAVIETRLAHAAAADLVLAFYNPISKARPWQLGRALEILRCHRDDDTRVVLGRDVGRPGETLTATRLGALRPEQVDMRTLVIVGSSTTTGFARDGGGEWIYTPRWYPTAPG